MAARKSKYIDASDFTLEKWLKQLFIDKDSLFPNNHFPNEAAKQKYLSKIKTIPENKVKDLLRILIQNTGRIGFDNVYLSALISSGLKKYQKVVKSSEYWRRNSTGRTDVWEGLTWVIDLLPNYPKEAIQTLNAHFSAHMWNMSDHQIWSNGDCIDIIIARYYDLEHPRTILLDIEDVEFEWLIEYLYKDFGYVTELTSKSNDKGIDIIANKNEIGKREKTIIQCKKYTGNVGSPFIRDLLGIVTSVKATKGVLVSTSEFTKEAIKFADDNPSIELIGYKKLNKLLNMHLGTNWPLILKNIFRSKRQELDLAQRTT